MKSMENIRGQAEILSVVMLFGILIVVLIVGFTWGKGIYDSQQVRLTADKMTSKLFEVKSAILAVTHEGLNSSRIVNVDVPVGELRITNGGFCSNKAMSGNSISFNVTTTEKLISSEDWISIDPAESNTSCDAPYENSSAAVLMGKAEKAGNNFVNSYTLWFRNLTQANGASNNFYVINISPGDTSEASGGSHRIIVRNNGTLNSSFTVYTSIKVDII